MSAINKKIMAEIKWTLGVVGIMIVYAVSAGLRSKK